MFIQGACAEEAEAEGLFPGCSIDRTEALDNTHTIYYLKGFGDNYIILPDETDASTRLVIFSNCNSTARWYAVNNNVIVMEITPAPESWLDVKTSDIAAWLIDTYSPSSVTWAGFSAGTRSAVHSMSEYLADNPDAPPQTVILFDAAVAEKDNFTCITDDYWTSDTQMLLYRMNSTRFICVSKNELVLESEGVQKLAKVCDVCCILTPFKVHSGSYNVEGGIVWNSFSGEIEDNLYEWSLGNTDSLNEIYEILELPWEDSVNYCDNVRYVLQTVRYLNSRENE